MLLAVSALAACGGQEGDRAQAIEAESIVTVAAADPPSWDEAAYTSYAGIAEATIALSGGEWEGEPWVEGGASRPAVGLVRDFRLTGDLDGDGAEESVFLLWTSSGGSGTFDYLAALGRAEDGSALALATAALGDRVKIRSADIVEGRIVLEVLQAGREDAACCPGQKFKRIFALEGGAMNEVLSEDQGRLSVNDLAGNWRLTHFGRDEEVPQGIDINLRFEGDRIGGVAACNNYSGAVIEGESPGELYVAGPIALTRKMCPPPSMEAEQRYLGMLQNIERFSFVAGRLLLSWRSEEPGGGSGVLLYSKSGD
jgi:heat shock protein HslJ